MSPEHPLCSAGPLGLPDNDTAAPGALDCWEGSGVLQAGREDIPAELPPQVRAQVAFFGLECWVLGRSGVTAGDGLCVLKEHGCPAGRA